MITIDVAGISVRFENRFPYTENICRDYATEREPLYVFSATDEDLSREAEYDHDFRMLPYLESSALQRKAAEVLPLHDRVFCHGAVIVAEGKAYLFSAKSGVGKTTHIDLWKKVFGDEVFVLNGDKPVLGYSDGAFFAYGTPWRGKEEYGVPGCYPLGGIVFLERGEENRVEPVPPAEGLMRLCAFLYMPKEKSAALATLAFCDRILTRVPLFRLFCNMEDEAAKVAYQALIHERK